MESAEISGRLLAYARNFDHAAILHSHSFPDPYGRWEWLAGFGVAEAFTQPGEVEASGTLKFGFISYDLKNQYEKLSSKHDAAVAVPDFWFFEPRQWIGKLRNGEICGNLALHALPAAEKDALPTCQPIHWQACTGREQYLHSVARIRECIAAGDFYEMNHCIQFEAETELDPFTAFSRLQMTAPAPFSAFYKFGGKYLLCSSPERFLRKQGEWLISQPIKGTRRRQPTREADMQAVAELYNSQKERAENTMIVDLVRNDLSHVCRNGSVTVPELCGIHSFSHVHQMISTVTGRLLPGKSLNDILAASFPMGSMTGAPKIEVMQDTERFENFRRGWYSGSAGYWENGDFDLNVVIRSLQYDQALQKLVYNVGSAITYDSVAEEEFQECMDKAAGILAALQ
ncbi:MAG: anthranilate synthase component I family protein [Bacteroidetes bacterium]|nr:anthranilate synthase component I family protein [Bacteroidota bacterium]